MLIELHCHTAEHSSCSKISAADLVMDVYKSGISGLVFTDHHYLWSHDEIKLLRASLDIPEKFLILSGQEVFTKDFGDILVYGAPRTIDERLSLSMLRNICPDAALVWAHPYRGGQTPTEVELFDPALDAIEIFNPHQKEHENQLGLSDWQMWGFVATSGTDIHEANIQPFYATSFQGKIFDMNDLISSIKYGGCRPSILSD